VRGLAGRSYVDKVDGGAIVRDIIKEIDDAQAEM